VLARTTYTFSLDDYGVKDAGEKLPVRILCLTITRESVTTHAYP